MHVQCPQCKTMLNIVDVSLSESASCPSCGSQVPLGTLTLTRKPSPKEHIAHFELIEPVGMGHFGVVWKARDTRLERIVAVKVQRWEDLYCGERDTFLREAQATASLEHPNIVRVHEVVEEAGRCVIVSQFIRGVTLAQALKARQFTWAQKAELLAKVCEAVHYAHEHGVIHRDLKPGNILLDTEDEPFVTDFGLAKRDNAEVTMTAEGVVLGTPAYMSPEQARGDNQMIDRRSDVFSLGVMLYEMLVGERPFSGPGLMMLYQIESTDPRTPRSYSEDVPRDLETICLKALSKAREKRYQSAGEFADDLRRFLSGNAILARRATWIERCQRWLSKNRLTAAMGVFCCLSAVALASRLTTHPEVDPRIQNARRGSVIQVIEPRNVSITTEPEGATVVFYPRDPLTGELITEKAIRPDHKSPCKLQILPGEYFVVAALDDARFHEVIRTVPGESVKLTNYYRHQSSKVENGITVLPRIRIPEANITAGMTLLEGDESFTVGIANSTLIPQHPQDISSFYLDTHEVSLGELRAGFQGSMPESLKGKQFPSLDLPATGILIDEAILYAELIGKRLPTEFEYEFAATQRGTTIFPWGDEIREHDRQLRSVKDETADHTNTAPPIYGLFSNAEEYTASLFTPYPQPQRDILANVVSSPIGSYITIRDLSDAAKHTSPTSSSLGVRARRGVPRISASPELGFRCARSKSPRI